MYGQWISTLLEVKLFNNIESDELNNIISCLSPNIYSYKKGAYITIEGDAFTGIGIVLKGEVVVTKENIVGDRVIMAKLEEKNIFGEVVAFSNNNQWPATVIAVEDCTILFLAPEKIVGNCPHMCFGHKLLIQNMLKIVSQKAIHLDHKIKYLSMKSIRAKVSMYLLEQYDLMKKNSFMIPLKRHELAEYLNVSRPSLSRELIKMKDEETIDFYKASFKILNMETLKSGIQ